MPVDTQRNGAIAEAGRSPRETSSERVEEFVLAGMGLLKDDSTGKRPKKFRKAVKRGRKRERDSREYDGILAQAQAGSPVHVRPGSGGGWYEVWVRGIQVDKVQGEDAALRRMAELTLEYVEVGEADRTAPMSMRAGGGGWYDLLAHGVVVDRVQGEQEAQARADELLGSPARES